MEGWPWQERKRLHVLCLSPPPLAFSGVRDRMCEEVLATMDITRSLMHYQEETEPAGKQDSLETDPSPVPGGRARGRKAWAVVLGLAESSFEAWGAYGEVCLP